MKGCRVFLFAVVMILAAIVLIAGFVIFLVQEHDNIRGPECVMVWSAAPVYQEPDMLGAILFQAHSGDRFYNCGSSEEVWVRLSRDADCLDIAGWIIDEVLVVLP